MGDHGRLAALGKEDSEGLIEEDRSLGSVLEVLHSRHRLPAVAQRQHYVFTARRWGRMLVGHLFL
jgi:hypothetical protein